MLGLAEWVEALICGLSAPRMGPCFQERPSGSSEGGQHLGIKKKGSGKLGVTKTWSIISFFFFFSPVLFSLSILVL